MFPQKVSCMFPATENPKNLFFLWVIINVLKCTLPHSQQLAKVLGAVHVLNSRNGASRRRSLQVGRMRLQTRAQEKTTRTHSETQLPLYCSMTVVHNCPRAPGLVWLWHTPRMAPRPMGNMIWATHFPGRVFPTITKTNHFSPWNVERQITSNQSNSSLVTVCTSQATEQHRTRGAGLPSTNHKAPREHRTHAYISL